MCSPVWGVILCIRPPLGAGFAARGGHGTTPGVAARGMAAARAQGGRAAKGGPGGGGGGINNLGLPYAPYARRRAAARRAPPGRRPIQLAGAAAPGNGAGAAARGALGAPARGGAPPYVATQAKTRGQRQAGEG
jgi:hypothetical protein